MTSFLRKLGWLRERPAKEADLEEELRFHLSEEADAGRDRGLSAQEARTAARRELGNYALVQEETRAAWTWTPLEQLAKDARYAFRTMAANKTFSALAVLSLALGIGANTAIFSFMDSILVRPLPVRDPQSLVSLAWHVPKPDMHGTNRHDDSYTDPSGGFVGGFFSYPAFELFQRDDRIFASLFGYQGAGILNLSVHGQAELANAEYVTGEYFRGLDVPPAAGRLIGPEDDRAGMPAVAIVSYRLAQKRFGEAEKAPGQQVLLNNLPFTVVGVAAPEFFGADPDQPPDLYLPMHANLLIDTGNPKDPPARIYGDPQYDFVVTMGRLRKGVSRTQAMGVLAPQYAAFQDQINPRMRPEERPRLLVQDGAAGLDGLKRRYAQPLYILLTLVALILTIACANIANLLLARAAARNREMAVRLSIGAGRWRVVRQLLTESVVLASLGGLLGIGFAIWGIRGLTLLMANGRENYTLRAELNWHVLGLAAGLSVLTGVLFGLAPALQATRVDLIRTLKEARTNDRRARGRFGISLSRALMVTQIAITLVILVTAGLFLRTLSNLESIPLGFDQEGLLTFAVNARQAGHEDPEIVSWYENLRKQLEAIPGVRSASLSNHSMVGGGRSGTPASTAKIPGMSTQVLTIGPAFFATLKIPLLRGRATDERDGAGAALAAVVNQSFAKKAFADADPVGQHIAMRRSCKDCDIEIVGVVADTVYGDIKATREPTVYLPYGQNVWGGSRGMVYELRTAGNPCPMCGRCGSWYAAPTTGYRYRT